MVHKKIKIEYLDTQGSTLIMAIIAIIVIGALGVGMQQMSSSAVFNQLMFNQANQARNLAYSGVKYTKGLIYSYQTLGNNFTKFKDDLTANGGVYDLGNSTGKFVITVPSYTTTGNTTSFSVNVLGKTPDGSFQSQYQLPSNVPLTYTYTPSTPPVNPNVPRVLVYGNNVNFSGDTYSGDAIFKSYTFSNGGVKIYGSIDYVGTGSACLILNGNTIGKTDGSSHICSNSCISVPNNVTLNGEVRAAGDITLTNGKVNGTIRSGNNFSYSSGGTSNADIYAVGNVTISNGTINGNIYSGGSVSVKNSIVTGSITAVSDIKVDNGSANGVVTAGRDVTMIGWSSYIRSAIYYHRSWNPPPSSSSHYPIAPQYVSTVPSSPSIPETCSNYTLPSYVNKTVTKTDPGTASAYTITGSTNIDDQSWVFASFNLTNHNPALCLDLSQENSYINIFVNQNFNLDGVLQLKTPTSGSCKNITNYSLDDQKIYAKKIYLAVGGATKFTGGAHNWVGTIFSQGNISGPNTLNVVGALYSNGTIDTNGGSTSSFVSSDYVNKNW